MTSNIHDIWQLVCFTYWFIKIRKRCHLYQYILLIYNLDRNNYYLSDRLQDNFCLKMVIWYDKDIAIPVNCSQSDMML